jgi:hypothetical protein
MHIYYIRVLISFVGAAIPAIVAIAKWKKIPPSYYPFIWFIWLTVLGEISATITAQVYKNNAVPSNIYILLMIVFFNGLICSCMVLGVFIFYQFMAP